MSYRITDTAYSPKETGNWNCPVLCAHCGEAKGMHWQHADGRIVCVEFPNDVPPAPTSNPHYLSTEEK